MMAPGEWLIIERSLVAGLAIYAGCFVGWIAILAITVGSVVWLLSHF